MCKIIYEKGPQHACSTYLFKHLLQQFRNCKTSNNERPPENVLKVSFKAIHDFNCTMMASFLTGIVIKRNKQIEKNMPFTAVPHKFT